MATESCRLSRMIVRRAHRNFNSVFGDRTQKSSLAIGTVRADVGTVLAATSITHLLSGHGPEPFEPQLQLLQPRIKSTLKRPRRGAMQKIGTAHTQRHRGADLQTRCGGRRHPVYQTASLGQRLAETNTWRQSRGAQPENGPSCMNSTHGHETPENSLPGPETPENSLPGHETPENSLPGHPENSLQPDNSLRWTRRTRDFSGRNQKNLKNF